jgi:sulfotransferase family protein
MGNPYVFIVGCPRSGTTSLQRMVNAHPQIAITPESHWIPRLYAKPWLSKGEGRVTKKLIRTLLSHPKFARLKISQGELATLAGNGQRICYEELVSNILDLYGHRQGKFLVGDKTPDYVRNIETLHTLWPSARFVHLIRDGRDMALSMMEWPKVRPKPGDFATWREDKVSTAALWWELNVRLGRQAGKSLGPGLYFELRYESLVNDPREESAALCEFLGVPYDDAMLRFYESGVRTDPGLEKKRASIPVTASLRDWRSQLPPEDNERFEAAAGTLLEELNYDSASAARGFGACRQDSRLADPGPSSAPLILWP